MSAFAALALSGTARAHSTGTGKGGGRHAVITKPRIDLTSPADSTDFTHEFTHELNADYDQYTSFKNTIQNDLNVQFSMPVSIFGQWGSPNGGPGVAVIVYSPTVTWMPFTNTAIGSGAFTFSFQGNQFWTRANTNSQQGDMGLLAAPNSWGSNGYQYAQITYTQTFLGKWLAFSCGQYSFGQYDGNVQSNFLNYSLAQNGTQTYASAGVGAYVQLTPNQALQFAGGLQGATDISGETVTTNGFRDGEIAYFLSAQWSPTFLAGGTYGILYYDQPSVPQQPSASQGLSFSAVQYLNASGALFLRVNDASGTAIPIETSVAFRGIMNNPFGRNRLDQAGLGLAWNKTNQTAVGSPARSSEWVGEFYYNITVFKGMHITPDMQVFVHSAFAQNTGAVVFAIYATFNF